uniref:Ferredoxin-thioredoxin reductase beta subunit n=1 Tax=Heterosigma akashiwo TaxID=2829 RepID=A0A224AER6_HETAK|nr:ferredoxin-thioredoxin reductase beta subunit [Heterosigma akashiwo]BBA18347.1 ferredoxin-thioredoxin reductase beta subunit [Heterosigma akashiwo]BBA18486.1 ferredoxin-thioredoxin reductase beta subunit [Heterosigma akashiwo]BBA18624.1 ferredoxin-thioredoxin reductase beta subunit [Heterosigma akashiwo]BBA18763.1 ferredoxin-thioredoxin reductase beta subunit [Heterosigma akashiwo]
MKLQLLLRYRHNNGKDKVVRLNLFCFAPSLLKHKLLHLNRNKKMYLILLHKILQIVSLPLRFLYPF